MRYFYLYVQSLLFSIACIDRYSSYAFTKIINIPKSGKLGTCYVSHVHSDKSSVSLRLAKAPAVTQKEAQTAINKITKALQRNKEACADLGKLQKVNNVLGYGSPSQNIIAVRFNASFSKAGKGMAAKPLPFMLGQSNEKEGRGTMVGQVKASLDRNNLKILECSVFRDLGYGRAFNLKV